MNFSAGKAEQSRQQGNRSELWSYWSLYVLTVCSSVRHSRKRAGVASIWQAAGVDVLRAVAGAGQAESLLLTDADIAHRPHSLAAMVEAATANGLDALSQMAVLRTSTGWERLIVPAFVYFFAMLYPFRWVNRSGARTAAAA